MDNQEEQESNLLFHGPCEACGSSDANAVYDDGHTYCFSCNAYGNPEGDAGPRPTASRVNSELLPVGEFATLGKRRITEETCRKFSYSIGEDKYGKACQIANYKRDGKIIAQHLRYPNKDFKFLGDKDKAGLWGEHVWRDGGKMLVITEGQIDALTVSQLQNNRWPVVSVTNGASGAVKSIRKSLEFVNGFEKVILMFDMDKPGQEAAIEAAKMLRPGTAYIANLPLKDANEMLLAGRGKEVISAMWEAKAYRPDGIINAADLWEEINTEQVNDCVEYPWEELNKKTRGARRGELVVWTAGSGVGKTAVVREVAYDLLNKGQTVGMLMLEENRKRTAKGMMGLHLNHPLHLDPGEFTEEQLHEAFEATAGSGRLWLYDHFGSTSAGNLLERIRYLASGCGCDFVILDHISIAVSDAEANSSSNLDERKLIDMLMTKLRSLVEELGIGLHVISHLRRPEGKGHEQGAMTSLSQLRGSHAIAQLSDMVIGLERDQQSEDARDETTLRVLKNRFSGETGEAGVLFYDHKTGRLNEHGLSPVPGQGTPDDY